MSQHNLVPPPSSLEPQFAINGMSQAAAQVATASDCLYQLAALTAGIFFLATLI
jgi:hypothetical protein